MRLLALFLVLAGGCHGPEHVAAPWDPPPRAVVDLGCVQLAPALLYDGHGDGPGIPLAISFHSECKEHTRLDLGRIRVTARWADGKLVTLVPFDPRAEIHAGLLAPGDTGEERIEYQAPAGSLTGWTYACVDFDAVLPDRPAGAAPPICLTPRARLVDPDALGEGGAP